MNYNAGYLLESWFAGARYERMSADFLCSFLTEMGGSGFQPVCCACLGRGVKQSHWHGSLGILILSAPLEQCGISICSAVIIIHISQHLFHLDRFNYSNRNWCALNTKNQHLISPHLLSSPFSSKLSSLLHPDTLSRGVFSSGARKTNLLL